MKLTIVKESFGPWHIEVSKELDLNSKREDGVTVRDHYLKLGGLYELERKPSGSAEKLFWREKNKKGELVRGSFNRGEDIPGTEDAKQRITAELAKHGYTDIRLTLRDVKETGPAYKVRAKVVGEFARDGVIDKDVAKSQLEKLAASSGVTIVEVMKYAGNF